MTKQDFEAMFRFHGGLYQYVEKLETEVKALKGTVAKLQGELVKAGLGTEESCPVSNNGPKEDKEV